MSPPDRLKGEYRSGQHEGSSVTPPPGGSAFADADAARAAVAFALPSIEAAIRDPAVCGLGFLHIVVMDPALSPGQARFDAAVLYEHSLGDRNAWDADYAAFARAKAEVSWRHGVDGQRVQCARPHALSEGESLLWGSVCLDGIVVAVSGAEAEYDEAFALCVAGALRAIAKQRHRFARRDGLLLAARR